MAVARLTALPDGPRAAPRRASAPTPAITSASALAAAPAPPSARGAGTVRWPAHLALEARREGGLTALRCRHEGPLRLLKTLYPEGPGVAHAVLLHPPGGLVGGDRLDITLDVQPGAHLLITSPGATRFYRSVAGLAAQTARAQVAAGARLEWLPQETLAYDGCQALSAWHVQLEGDATVLAMEVLALGLAEAHRPFLHGRFEQRFEVTGLWRERGIIDAADEALLQGPCGLAGRRVLGTLVLARGQAFEGALAEAALEAARSESAELGQSILAGATLLHGRLLLLRVVADEVEPAQRLLRRVRGRWRELCWRLGGTELRIWAT